MKLGDSSPMAQGTDGLFWVSRDLAYATDARRALPKTFQDALDDWGPASPPKLRNTPRVRLKSGSGAPRAVSASTRRARRSPARSNGSTAPPI